MKTTRRARSAWIEPGPPTPIPPDPSPVPGEPVPPLPDPDPRPDPEPEADRASALLRLAELPRVARDRALAWTAGRVTELVARKGMKLQALISGGEVLFPGVPAFIRAAAAAVPVAIASGALRHEIVQILESAALDELFAAIVASGDTPASKPSPAPYLLAFERLQERAAQKLDPRRCVAIEDSLWGLESSRQAGLRCVGVTTSYGAGELACAELVVDGLQSLTIPMLEQLVA